MGRPKEGPPSAVFDSFGLGILKKTKGIVYLLVSPLSSFPGYHIADLIHQIKHTYYVKSLLLFLVPTGRIPTNQTVSPETKKQGTSIVNSDTVFFSKRKLRY